MRRLQVLFLPVISICILIGLIIFVPPENPFLILFFMFLSSFIIYSIFRISFSKKISAPFGFFTFLTLLLLYLGQMSLINGLLLMSLLTATLILVK